MLRIIFILSIVPSILGAQDLIAPAFTPGTERVESFKQRMALQEKSIISELEFENIGPTVFSGRVSDLDVWEKDPSHFYVAYASGGLWKTENNGISFNPIFDHEMVMTIGDIAVDWEKEVIYLGSGEVNSSRSSYAGTGIFKSIDQGETWEHLGLTESHHIGRIILHPEDPNTLWVAVLGHLYSPNKDRGVYKTTDGGKSWKQVLYVNDNTGAVDLIMDPINPDILYAATWHRERRAWNFVEAGIGSGIYKSTNGGENWTLLTTEISNFPLGEGVGRIGLDIHKKGDQTVLYAALDNYDRRPKKQSKDSDELTKDALRGMTKEAFAEIKDYQLKDYLSNNRFPKKYNVKKIKKMVASGQIKPTALIEYVEDANSLLFDTPVIGLEIYKSEDEGKTWTKTHKDFIDGVYNSYGYYFGQIKVSPHNADKIYVLGVPIIKSTDGGKSFESINGDNVHADHHALWLNPDRDEHLILGNDGGVNISYDDGALWNKCNSPSVGQFYYIAVDMAKPYNVYGGLQDNGVWMGSHKYQSGTRWHSTGKYPYKSIMGGDGMQVAIDTRDNVTVYTGFQFGNYFRVNTRTGKRTYITPRHELGERPLRWNWQSPIHLSIHNQDILYMGSNKLHRSMNQGGNFKEISEDLTKGGKKGDVPFGTLSTIHESPLKFGLLYTGSDDGLVHVSQDGGNYWTNISSGLPDDMWVSRVQASAFKESRVYVALNGYRWDNMMPMVYVSDDFGKNWTRIGLDLPMEPVNVVKEDPVNQNLLYVGTDHGLYVSIDRGQSFMLAAEDIPYVPVHDLVIHPRDHHVLVGTHGRSIYKASAKELQQLKGELLAENLHAFEVEKIRYSSRWGTKSWRFSSDPEVKLPMYSNAGGKVFIKIMTQDGLKLNQMERSLENGLNYPKYDLSIQASAIEAYLEELNKDKKAEEKPVKLEKADNGKVYLYKGEYEVVISNGTEEVKMNLVVE